MGKKGGIRIKQVGPKAPPKMFNPMDELAIPPDEMINLPPPPDRNYQIFWPIQQTFSMDASQFHIIYPSYLDSTKTIAQGRRIGQEVAVEMPTVSDISQALQSLNIRHVLQPHKGYSRDIETLWENPGRVKFDASNCDSKRQLLKELAQIIPNLPARQQRLEQAKQLALLEQQKAEEEAQKSKQSQKLLQQQQHQQQQRATTTGKTTTNKKKGKKKR